MRIRTLVENEEKFDRLRILLFINLRNAHPPLYTQNKNDGREIEFVNPITNRGSKLRYEEETERRESYSRHCDIACDIQIFTLVTHLWIQH